MSEETILSLMLPIPARDVDVTSPKLLTTDTTPEEVLRTPQKSKEWIGSEILEDEPDDDNVALHQSPILTVELAPKLKSTKRKRGGLETPGTPSSVREHKKKTGPASSLEEEDLLFESPRFLGTQCIEDFPATPSTSSQDQSQEGENVIIHPSPSPPQQLSVIPGLLSNLTTKDVHLGLKTSSPSCLISVTHEKSRVARSLLFQAALSKASVAIPVVYVTPRPFEAFPMLPPKMPAILADHMVHITFYYPDGQQTFRQILNTLSRTPPMALILEDLGRYLRVDPPLWTASERGQQHILSVLFSLPFCLFIATYARRDNTPPIPASAPFDFKWTLSDDEKMLTSENWAIELQV